MRKLIVLLLCLSCLSAPALATNTEGEASSSSDPGEAVTESGETLTDTEVESGGIDDSSSDVTEGDVLLPEETSSSDQTELSEDSGDSESGDSGSVSGTPDDPVAVMVIEPDASYAAVYSSGSSLDLEILDEAPPDPPFYGSLYVTGETSSGDVVTIYLPTNYKEGYLGVDSSGRLFNVSATSISGYYDGAYNNSISLPAFSYPRYRTSSSSYDYADLYLVPQYSNAQIATATPGVTTFSELVPYFSLLLLGVIFVCCIKRS